MTQSDHFRRTTFIGLTNRINHPVVNFSTKDCVRAVKNLKRLRQKRACFYPESLFGEPAWDILLDVFQAEMEERTTTIKAASLASNVSNTSALRWICVLEKHGLLTRSHDPDRKRRVYLHATPRALNAMSMYIASTSSR